VEESVDTPFVQKWALTYLGVDNDWYAASRANNRFVLDSRKHASFVESMKNPTKPAKNYFSGKLDING
jgi:hypothetical protein